MRKFLVSCTAALALAACPAHAHIARLGAAAVETVSEQASDDSTDHGGGERLVESATQTDNGAPEVRAIAAFGPFRVIDTARAALVRETDSSSPAAFKAMLTAYPGIRTIEFIECPGTLDDVANLQLGRMIRARGLDTDVPDGGSVRSGAVELFLAGLHRRADDDADFAVHSWRDDTGREPRDVPAADPVNRTYIAYYQQMGLTAEKAAAFYALTNSVRNEDALWLKKADIAKFAAID
jgi:hypothetical protein